MDKSTFVFYWNSDAKLVREEKRKRYIHYNVMKLAKNVCLFFCEYGENSLKVFGILWFNTGYGVTDGTIVIFLPVGPKDNIGIFEEINVEQGIVGKRRCKQLIELSTARVVQPKIDFGIMGIPV